MRRYLLALGTMVLAPLVIAAALDRQSSEANLRRTVTVEVAGRCRQLQSRKACGLPPRRGAGTSAGVTPSRVEVVCRCAFAT